MIDHSPGLRIAALLPSALQPRFLAAVETLPGTIILWATNSTHLGRLLYTHDVSLVVVDPVNGGSTLQTNVRRLLRRRPAIPLIVYTAITPTSLQVVAALGRLGLREVVFTSYEDAPERFARTLQRVAATARDASINTLPS
ncbi:MAG TPA: hypothetical protein VNU46_06455 [Gemmatimonadaceae bacterium]|nr:hypothetical protein [Gemmatimonadaceae bacterium]